MALAVSTCLYADPKVGKTLACIYAAWDAAFVGPKDSAVILPAQAMLGFTPVFTPVQLISQIEGVAIEAKKRGYAKLVVDDATHIALNTEAYYKEKFSGSNNRYAPWNAFRSDLQRMLFVVCNQLGMSIWFTAHEKAPQDERTAENGQTKKALRGGPRLPLGMQEDLPSFMDCVYRVQHSQSSPRGLVRFGWPYVLRAAGAEPDYVSGDRINVAPDCAHLNLAELYREAGYGEQFKRPPTWHEWIEGAVTHYSALLVKHEKDLKLVGEVNGELIRVASEAFHDDQRVVDWTLNDASARAYLKAHGRRARQYSAWTGLGNLSSVPVVQSAPAASIDLGAAAGAAGVQLGNAQPAAQPQAPTFTFGAPNT